MLLDSHVPLSYPWFDHQTGGQTVWVLATSDLATWEQRGKETISNLWAGDTSVKKHTCLQRLDEKTLQAPLTTLASREWVVEGVVKDTRTRPWLTDGGGPRHTQRGGQKNHTRGQKNHTRPSLTLAYSRPSIDHF